MRMFALVFIACLTSGCVVTHVPVKVDPGGRAGLIAVHPSDNETMLVASETGGVFKTTDGGEKWSHVSSLPSFKVFAVAYSPSDPNIIIVTTFAQYRVGETGIWRSTNGGSSWSIPSNSRMPPSARCPDIIRAYGIAFDPDNTDRVYVGTDCGLAISDDAGASWTHVQIDAARNPGGRKLQNQVAGVIALPGGKVHLSAKDGIWHSEDSGATWTKSVSGPNVGSESTMQVFAVSPFSDDHVYLAHRAHPYSRLYFSTDGGQNYVQLAEYQRGWARPLFVRTARIPTISSPTYRVYFGEGVRVREGTFLHNTPPVQNGGWTILQENHPDPSDIAVHSNGSTLLLLTTDGGVHTLDTDGVWRMSGAGEDGYNALQITDMTGQQVSGSNPHLDLYFATQDNSIRASDDGGESWPGSHGPEGFHIRVAPTSAVNHNGSTVTGMKCAPCRNFKTDEHLTNPEPWPNAPDGDAEDDTDGVPFVLPTTGHYIQGAIDHDEDPLVYKFKLTTNTGASWQDSYIVDPQPKGRPVIVGSTTDPVVYQAVRRPGQTTSGFERLGLVRVQRLYDAAGGTLADADVTGLGGLGIFPTMFAWYPVVGANPRIPNQLLAPDIGSDQMKFSYNGGQTWHVHQQLTDLVTNNGEFAFRERRFPIVSVVQFDPYDACHVLVGTTQNGIFRSVDGGVTFKKIKKSDKVTNVSSFYFPPTGRVWVSTYGRSLWKLKVSRKDRTRCIDLRIPPDILKPPHIWDIIGGQRLPFKWPPEPPGWCPNCDYIIVKHGVITGIDQQREALLNLTLSGGFIYQFDSAGREVPLTISNSYGRVGQEPAIAKTAREGALAELPFDLIRGVVIEGTKLRGIITAGEDLPVSPARVPYISIVAKNSPTGFATVGVGDSFRVTGSGFEPTTDKQLYVTVLIAGEVAANEVKVTETGTFNIKLSMPDLPAGDYAVQVRQQVGERLTVDQTEILVVSNDNF